MVLILMKNKCPHLNTLPPRRISWRRRIHKRRMRDPPCPPILLAIKTLDQKHLLRLQPALVEPAVGRAVADVVRLAAPVGMHELDHDEVRLRHRRRLGHGQRVALDRLDGPPHVDDLHAAAQEPVGVLGEVVRDAGEGRVVGLVDVDPLDGAIDAGVAGWMGRVWAADGVVEDEYAGCAGAVTGGRPVPSVSLTFLKVDGLEKLKTLKIR